MFTYFTVGKPLPNLHKRFSLLPPKDTGRTIEYAQESLKECASNSNKNGVSYPETSVTTQTKLEN
jgi:hypothetical protein